LATITSSLPLLPDRVVHDLAQFVQVTYVHDAEITRRPVFSIRLTVSARSSGVAES
jgi:hypothetical protein